LIIDVGSSSVRALLFDDRATIIAGALAQQPQHINTQPLGAATLDISELQHKVEQCIDQIMQHPAARGIRVVGMATLVGNLLGLDETGSPITPVYTYADMRAREVIPGLQPALDLEALHQRTGCRLHSAYHPARLAWLRGAEPDLFARVAQWTDISTYLYQRWFGEATCSYSVASWSGLLNRSTLEWYGRVLETIGVSAARLPRLADYNEYRQGLSAEFAARWPALADVPFCLAVGDGAAANIGSGCVTAEQVALTVGTTAALRVVSDDILPRVPEGLWGYRVDAMHHLMGGATSEGGNIFEWARRTLKLGSPEEVEQELMQRAPDSHGLTFLPLLAGERSPGWSDNANGVMYGLRLSTTPLEMMQAAMEGVALRLALVFEQLQPLTSERSVIIGGGGALKASMLWANIIANALNRPLHIIQDAEVTARGVAILAFCAVGLGSLTDYPPTLSTVIEPAAGIAALLAEARERQQELYQVMFGTAEL
jgi:gluconokinase